MRRRLWIGLSVALLDVACALGNPSPPLPREASLGNGDASSEREDAAARADGTATLANVDAASALPPSRRDARPPPDGATDMAPGCGLSANAGDSTWSLTSGGESRTLTVHIPTGYDPTTPTPVVMNFHGEFSDGSQEEWLTGMSAKADLAHFIVIYPEGVGESWNAGGDCCGTALEDNVDDVAFVEAVLALANTRLCIDPRRIFATGMSNGAYLAHRLGCALAGTFAAIAPVAGVLSVPPACNPTQPVPVLEFHGTADPLVPYDGGGTVAEPSVPATFEGWSMRDGCTGAPVVTFQSGDVTCNSYTTCQGGAEVTLCTVTGGGHAWPGGQSVPLLGYTTNDISATDSMWTFFQDHPLP